MKNNYIFKTYYSLNDWGLSFFLNEIKENFDSICKHDCALNENNISENDKIIIEIEYHFHYWNILKFLKDLNENNININSYFKEDYLIIVKKIYKNIKENLIQYESFLFSFFINNWEFIKNLETSLFNIYFSDFLNTSFWTKKSLIKKNKDVMLKIVDFLSNDQIFIKDTLKNFSHLNEELKYKVIKNIDKYFLNESKLLNSELIFEMLKTHYKFLKNDIYIEEKMILVINYFTYQSSIYKIILIDNFNKIFEKTKIINNKIINSELENFKKTINLNELKTIDIGNNEIIKNIFNFKEFHKELIYKIMNKNFIFIHLNKEKTNFTSIFEHVIVPENNLVKLFDNRTFNILYIFLYPELLNTLSNSYNEFFISNVNEYYEYFNQILKYLELIAHNFKFTNLEYLCFYSWMHSIFESFNLLTHEKNLYRYQGYLYCLIQLIEFLIKKIYLFKNPSIKWKEQFKISLKLKVNESAESYEFNSLFYEFLSKSTVKIIYWLLYLDKDKRGKDLRNLFMHGDINTLYNDSFYSVFWLRILVFSMIEEIFWNILKKYKK